MQIHKNVVISFILLLLLLFFYFYFNQPDYVKNFKEHLLNIQKEKFMEGFQNSPNIIHNGSFQYGENIKQLNQKKGDNKISQITNPGDSSYVLQQTGKDTFYSLTVPVEAGKEYRLSYWIGKTVGWNGRDKNFNIKLGKRLLSGNGTVIGNKDIGNTSWKKYFYQFKVANDDPNTCEIYLGYKPRSTVGERYFTDVKMLSVVIGDKSFPVSARSGMHTYVNLNDQTRQSVKDLSNEGNDMKLDRKPILTTDGGIQLRGNNLNGILPVGPIDGLTIMLLMKNNNNDTDVTTEIKLNSLIKIGGNQGTALDVKINDQMHKLFTKINKKQLEYSGQMLRGKEVLSIVYNKGSISVYQGDTLLKSGKGFGKLNLNGKIVINPNKDIDIVLYSGVIYKKALSKSQITDVVNHLKNLRSRKDGDSVYDHMTNMNVPGDVGVRDQSKMITTDDLLGSNDNAFIEDHDTTAQRGIKDTWHERNGDLGQCLSEYADEIKKHNITGGEEVIPKSCQKVCSVEGMESNPVCKTINERSSKKVCRDDECPTAFLSGDDFMVYVKAGTKYAEQLGRSGTFSYGTNRHRAREIYLQNFKGCSVPEILTPHGYRGEMESCPFLINEMNPCKMDVCKGAKWNVKDVRKQNLSKKCRRSISNYCDRFKYKDDACMCWRDGNKNTKECKELRDHIDQREENCRVDVFEIEDHPDINNYIRKDKVPCWNCNLK